MSEAKINIQPFQPPLGFHTPEQVAFVQEAYAETMKRYVDTGDVQGALIFFISAAGLLSIEPSAEDIAWAHKALS